MMKLFRLIKQKLLIENKFRAYIFYAIGEISLVVIGILIALQVNNWKQLDTESKLEKKYLKNLVNELRQDSIGLQTNFIMLKNQARTKSTLLHMIKNEIKGDSIIEYFDYQWRPIQPYTPIKTTYTEMISNSHLSIIKNDTLRKLIIRHYNTYTELEKEEDFYSQTSTANTINAISRRLPDISNYNENDILLLKSDKYLLNTIQLNGAYTRHSYYKSITKECSDLIAKIKEYENYKNNI